MGLRDLFRRSAEPDGDGLRRLGNLEGQFEGLRIQWVTYRDELRKLSQRLEKRDQRAEEKAAREAEVAEVVEETPPRGSETDERVRRRRAGGMTHAVPIRSR